MKYTQEQVEEIYKEQGWILNDKYVNNHTPMHCYDKEGYQYRKILGDVLAKKSSWKFHPKNPYTLENIDLYFKLNNITLKRLSDTYIDSKTPMKWQCECTTIFDTSWNEITQGKHYCEFCCRSKRFDGYRDYMGELLAFCEQHDYTLLSDDIKRCTQRFDYICNKHQDKGVQHSTYDTMVSCNRGCRYCGIESRTEKHKIEEWKLRELAESKGFIYAGYSYPNIPGQSNKVDIHIICPKHINKGIQKVKYNNLQRNTGKCVYCVGFGRTQEDLQTELDNMHGTIQILHYTNYADDIIVQCRVCGHIWTTNGMKLTQGRRCPNCNKSTFEVEVSDFLDEKGCEYVCQKWFLDCRDKNPLPFDFYLPKDNILIEADGEGHYKPIRRGSMTDEDAEQQLQIIQKHDEIKTKYCIDNHIKLIRIPYWERKNLYDFLTYEIENNKN